MRKHACLLFAAALAACGPSAPDPAPRVVSVVPEGEGITPDVPEVAVRFSEPVEASGVEDGRFVALATEADAKSVATAAATATGIGPTGAVVAGRVVLADAGRLALWTPDAPLQPMSVYAVVVGTGIRSAGGRAVLDPTGRKRAFATTFRTGAMPDRVPPQGRWIAPPGGPVPTNLKEIRLGFSEAVTGALSVKGVPGAPRAVSPEILALALSGPLSAGPLAPVLDDVRDAGGNRPAPLSAISVSPCRDDRAPVLDPATLRILSADTSLSVAAEAGEPVRLGVEVAVERLGEACGALPDSPGSLVAWGDFAACPGWDPCGGSSRCPAVATVTGLCPGKRGRFQLNDATFERSFEPRTRRRPDGASTFGFGEPVERGGPPGDPAAGYGGGDLRLGRRRGGMLHQVDPAVHGADGRAVSEGSGALSAAPLAW